MPDYKTVICVIVFFIAATLLAVWLDTKLNKELKEEEHGKRQKQ